MNAFSELVVYATLHMFPSTMAVDVEGGNLLIKRKDGRDGNQTPSKRTATAVVVSMKEDGNALVYLDAYRGEKKYQMYKREYQKVKFGFKYIRELVKTYLK